MRYRFTALDGRTGEGYSVWSALLDALGKDAAKLPKVVIAGGRTKELAMDLVAVKITARIHLAIRVDTVYLIVRGKAPAGAVGLITLGD